MADVLPKNRASDHTTAEKQDTGKLSAKGEGPLTNGKLASRLRSPTTSTHTAAESPGQQNGAVEEERRPSDTAIDPLSQQILKRTNTSMTIPKVRTQATENTVSQLPTSPNDAHVDTKYASDTTREVNAASAGKADKKKGVSFLSRFIGNKKKAGPDGGQEDGSDAGDSRVEGMDAQIFSHTVDNLGFKPKIPQPPAYIKVRAKFKKEKEFNRVFLAQELQSGVDKNSTPAAGSNPAPQSGSAATHNPIWATEFSQDGKYLAAGGQDRVVRVWAVISSAEERRSHEKDESEPNGASTHLSAPVFQQKTFREYHGHTATILDLSWSKNNFLLSSSMDKTVRLWHVSRAENLCTFKHSDFVPSIQFHPRDDRFFLAGSLDAKLRLWSIPDKSVAYWTQLSDMITAVAFTPDGKTCIAGTLNGICLFYQTEGLKAQSQIHVKSTRGQNAKGSKITGIQATYWPPGQESSEMRLLVSSNDSRIRLYNLRDKSIDAKFRGHENNCSQIRAFVTDTGQIICGSEDRKVYIWSISTPEGEKKNQRPMEMFEAHNSITTCATAAPLKTRQLLSASEDPIYDLCNPPPVTLVSRDESRTSSRAPTEADSALPTPASVDGKFRRVAESPAYMARSAHPDGNILVTADYTGSLKVFRQDCAYTKRMRASDNWESSSVFSKPSKLGRPSSILSRGTGRTRRDSTSTQPPNDRIMSWRQDISHGSFDSVNGPTPNRRRSKHGRSASPRKISRASMTSTRPTDSPALRPSINTTDTSHSHPPTVATGETSHSDDPDRTVSTTKTSKSPKPPPSDATDDPPRNPSTPSSPFDPVHRPSNAREPSLSNPMTVYNGQSWAFWNTHAWSDQFSRKSSSLAPRDAAAAAEDRGRSARASLVSSRLSSEVSASAGGGVSEGEGEGEDKRSSSVGMGMRCGECGGEEFRVRIRGVGEREMKVLVCGGCGTEGGEG